MSADKCLMNGVAGQIARAAARLFAAKGYDATPVRSIVEAAGVTKPALYYHYKSKEGLAQALIHDPLSKLVAALTSLEGTPLDPVERLEQSLNVNFEFCREDPDRGRFVYAIFFGPLGSELASELAHFIKANDAVMLSIVGKLADAGLIDVGRVGDMASACRGMIVMSTMDFLYSGKDLGPDLPRRLVGELLHGFAKDGARVS